MRSEMSHYNFSFSLAVSSGTKVILSASAVGTKPMTSAQLNDLTDGHQDCLRRSVSLWQVDLCVVLRWPVSAGWLSLDLQAAAPPDSLLIYGIISLMFSLRTSETSASPLPP